MRRAAAALLAALPLAAAAAPEPIRHGPADAAVTGAAAAAWAASELAKPLLAPARCRWCEPTAADVAAREALRWSAPAPARRASDVLAFGLVPAAVAGHQLLAARARGDAGAGWVDLLVIAQTAALAADLTQAVKLAAGRERPSAHAARAADPAATAGPDGNLSFWSGHASLAFSLAAAAGTVSWERGYAGAPWVLGGGALAATAVGWLRIAGDAHWLTDVVAGATAGAALGVALPRLLHPRQSGGVTNGGAATAPLAFAIAF